MTIPGSSQAPGTRQQINLLSGPTQLGADERILLIGYRRTGSSSAFDLVPQRVEAREQAQVLFGVGSQLAIMVARAFDVVTAAQGETPPGSIPQIWAQATPPPVAAVPSTPAVFTITVAGAPTASGSMPVYIGGQQRTVQVFTTDTPTTIAARIHNSILAIEPEIPFTSSTLAAVTTLTAREDGEAFNDFFVWVDHRFAPGIMVTIAQSQVSDGTVDLTAALAATEDQDWAIVVVPQYDTATRNLLKPHIDTTWDLNVQRRRRVIMGHGGTLATARTDARAIDDYRVMVASVERVVGSGIPWDPAVSARSFAWEAAASLAARIETQSRANYNYNGVELPGVSGRRRPLPGSAYDNAVNDGVTVILQDDANGFEAVVVDPLSTATTDQTSAQTGATDRQWAPFEIPRVIRRIALALAAKFAGFDQAVADDAFLIDAKDAALNVLRAAVGARWIAPVQDSAVTVATVTENGRQIADVNLSYGVIVGNDIVRLTHNVRRAN